MAPKGSVDIDRIVDDLSRAYAAEKIASTNTTLLIERARAAGMQFKQLAHGVAELLGENPGNVVVRATRLEAAFRQRVAQHRRRCRVIGDHKRMLAGLARTRAGSKLEDMPMIDNFGKPKFVREIYFELPSEDCHVDDDDHDLGDAGPAHVDRDVGDAGQRGIAGADPDKEK